MTSEMVDNTLAEAESEGDAVAKVTERCLRAEEQFGSGEIELNDLYKVYQDVYQNSIPPDVDVDFGPWSHIFWRRRRLLRLVNEKHLRKSRGCRGGHPRSQYWDACDWMDIVRDLQLKVDHEVDFASKKNLESDLRWWKRLVRSKAQEESKEWKTSGRAWHELSLRDLGLCDAEEEIEL